MLPPGFETSAQSPVTSVLRDGWVPLDKSLPRRDINGDGLADLVVGAPGAPIDAGAVWIYYGRRSSAPPLPDLMLVSPQGGRQNFGLTVAHLGDINADGYGDVAVHEVFNAWMPDGEGFVHVYLGGERGLSQAPIITLPGGGVTTFGRNMAGVGDLDGDSVDDVVIGAPLPSGSATTVLFGARGPRPSLRTRRVQRPPGSPGSPVQFGWVGPSGDLNRDGLADFTVSAPGNVSTPTAVYVYRGDRAAGFSGPVQVLSSRPEGGHPDASCDYDRDGWLDLVVDTTLSPVRRGLVLFRGGPSGFAVEPSRVITQPDDGMAAFAADVACAGDQNADGYPDLIVGAWGVRDNSGAAYILHGGVGGLTDVWTRWDGPNARGQSGWSVGGGSDFNGDGIADVFVGSPATDTPDIVGEVHLFRGASVPFSTSPIVFRVEGARSFGTDLAQLLAPRRSRGWKPPWG